MKPEMAHMCMGMRGLPQRRVYHVLHFTSQSLVMILMLFWLILGHGKNIVSQRGPWEVVFEKGEKNQQKTGPAPLEKDQSLEGERETKDEARLKRRELSHTTYIVVHTLGSLERGNTLEEQIHIDWLSVTRSQAGPQGRRGTLTSMKQSLFFILHICT